MDTRSPSPTRRSGIVSPNLDVSPDPEVKKTASTLKVPVTLDAGRPQPPEGIVLRRRCTLCDAVIQKPWQSSCGHRYHRECYDVLCDEALALCSDLSGCGQVFDQTKGFWDLALIKEGRAYDWGKYFTEGANSGVSTEGSLVAEEQDAGAASEQAGSVISSVVPPEPPSLPPEPPSLPPDVLVDQQDVWQDDVWPSCGAALTPVSEPSIQIQYLANHQQAMLEIIGIDLQTEHSAFWSSTKTLKAMTESGIVGLWQRMCNGPGSLPGIEYDLESHRQPCAESLVAKVESLKPESAMFFAFGRPVHMGEPGRSALVRIYRCPESWTGEHSLYLLITTAPGASASAPQNCLMPVGVRDARALVTFLLYIAGHSEATEGLLLYASDKTLPRQNLNQWQIAMPVSDAAAAITTDSACKSRVSLAQAYGLTMAERGDVLVDLLSSPVPECERKDAVSSCWAVSKRLIARGYVTGEQQVFQADPSSHRGIMKGAAQQVFSDAGAGADQTEIDSVLDSARPGFSRRCLECVSNNEITLLLVPIRLSNLTDAVSQEAFFVIKRQGQFILVSIDQPEMPVMVTDKAEKMEMFLTFLLKSNLSDFAAIQAFNKPEKS